MPTPPALTGGVAAYNCGQRTLAVHIAPILFDSPLRARTNKQPMIAHSLACALSALAITTSVSADSIAGVFPTPALDRWMYPFNGTPGTRPVISTFGSTPGAPEFDSRDGQMLLRFDTAAQVPPTLGAAQYTVTRAELHVQVAFDQASIYDPTQDAWQNFVATSDPNYVPDRDPGQSVECYGVGFRNGWTAQTFLENTAYAPAGTNVLQSGVRNAYAMDFGSTGTPRDVSQNPRQQFDPTPFGVGQIADLAPGSLIPAYSIMRFTLDVNNPHIQQYLRSAVNDGRLMLAVTSLTLVEQQSGQYPSFIAKENALVGFGLASPARLEIDVTVGPACVPADLTCDGIVDGADLGTLLGAWGSSGPGDLDANGIVDGADLGLLLGAWG